MKNINTFSQSKIDRNEILELNPDSIYGVYDLKEETDDGYELKLLENVLTCYQNQYDNLKGKDSFNNNIIILDIGELREGNIKVLHGNSNIKFNNPILLSNGVIEYVEVSCIDPKTGKSKKRKHIITTSRDGGAADKMQRTTFAGRNSTGNLFEDLQEEYIGEAPFLGKNKKGEYVLSVADISRESVKYLEEGIQKFLDTKYLGKNIPKEKKYIKKFFEVSFSGIKYEELGNILKDILKNKRYLQYESQKGNIEGLKDDMKEIKLGDSKLKSFVYFDKKNNTIEYREIRKLTKMPDDFELISRRPGRLYLESENQYPKIPRISNANNTQKLVPTVKYLCEKSIEK